MNHADIDPRGAVQEFYGLGHEAQVHQDGVEDAVAAQENHPGIVANQKAYPKRQDDKEQKLAGGVGGNRRKQVSIGICQYQ